jgi:NAD(P)H dehydrogenase (quinone)
MNHLIIYAHPDKESFVKKILEELITEAQNIGHQVVLRDLLEINFNPVLGYDDLKRIRNKDIAPEIIVEQEFIAKADIISVVYPIWYMSMPAIIKGYFDRTLTKGFAFDFEGQLVNGKLENKKVYLFSTAGLHKDFYDTMYLIENFNHIVDYGIFEFCGMEVISHEYFWSIPFLKNSEKKEILARVRQIVKSMK